MKPFTLYRSDHFQNKFNVEYPHEVVVIDKYTLQTAVFKDYVAAKYEGNHRKNDLFISSDCLAIDYDNSETDDPAKWIYPETIASRYPGLCFAVQFSRNHMKIKDGKVARPKWHGLLPLSEPITDPEQYRQLKERLLAMLFRDIGAAPDEGAKDAARFFYGTNPPEVQIFDGETTIDVFLESHCEPVEIVAEQSIEGVITLNQTSDSKSDGKMQTMNNVDDFQTSYYDLKIIPEGSRNATCYNAACSIIKHYGNSDKAREEYDKVTAKCSPALPQHEVEKIWNNALNFYSGKVLNDPEYITPGELELCPTDTEAAWREAGENASRPAEPQQTEEHKKILRPLERLCDLSEENVKKARVIVENLICAGLTILCAASKIGKSWMVLDMCLSVAAGLDFLGFKTNRCSTLYLALEDSKDRLMNRRDKQLNGREAPKNIYYAVESGTLENTLLAELESYIYQDPNIGLIVIDTLQKIRGAPKKNEGVYSHDYREMGMLKKFADSHNIALIMVHHTNKMKHDDDDFQNVSGTNAIMGAADQTIMIKKDNRFLESAHFMATGRDIDTINKAIQFNKNSFKWEMLGDDSWEKHEEAKHGDNPIVIALNELLKDKAEWSGTCSELMKEIQSINGYPIAKTAATLGRDLNKMTEDLRVYDRILHTTTSNGSGAAKHKFQRIPQLQEPGEEDPPDMEQTTLD